jgi:diguanylate cyclase (GGDEF)-like protein/PAS domain S-box-containing protein
MTVVTSNRRGSKAAPQFARWSWVVAVLASLSVVAMVAVVAVHSRNQDVSGVQAITENYARILDESLVGVIHNVDSTLLTVVDEMERRHLRRDGSDTVLDAYLERQLRHVPEALGLRVTDAAGIVRHVAGMPAVRGVNLADRQHFIQLRQDVGAGLVIAGPMISRISQDPVMVFARRLNRPDGSFGGMVHIAVATSSLVGLLGKLDLGTQGNSGLWTRTTLVARHSRGDPAGASTGAATPSPKLRGLLESGVRATAYHAVSGIDGIEREYHFRRVGDYPLYLVVGLAADDYLADWRRETAQMAGIAAVFVAVTLFFAWAGRGAWRRQEETHRALAESEQRLDLCIAGADLAMLDWEVEGDRLIFGEGWRKLLNYSPEELMARPAPLLELIYGEDIAPARLALARHLKGEVPMIDVEVRMRHRDGRWIWVLARGRAVERDAGGRVRRVTGIGMDISLRKETEAKVSRLSQWNELLLNSAGDGIIGVDLSGRCTFVNPAAAAALGYASDEVVGRNSHQLFHHHRHDGQIFPESECPVFLTLRDGVRRESESCFIRKSREVFPVHMTVTPIHEDSRMVGAEVIFQDIAHRKALEEELLKLATTDSLTGIANRRRLLEQMESELARIKRSTETSFLLMLDLDEFKRVNDTWGHSVGDAALRHFADICRQRIRQADFFGRLGGEEFGIVLSCTDRAGAMQLAESLRHSVAESPLQSAKGRIVLTVSIGIARFEPGDETSDDILVRADAALYRAKAQGRNVVVIDQA